MVTSRRSLAVVGCGTMGEAIVAGLLKVGEFSPDELIATARAPAAAERIAAAHRIAVTLDNVEACRTAGVALVALKPQRMREVLDRDDMREALAGKLVVSIAAGIRLSQLARWLPESALVRAMPNTPCVVGEGMTVLALGPGASTEHLASARKLFAAVGRVVVLEDKHMDAVTSLNGSGPAFAYVMLESLADGGVMMGLPRDVAVQIAAQVLLGSAKMVLQTGAHPAALKDQVTTPAGSTIAGLLVMEDGRVRSVLARAIQEATQVAAKLGRSDD